MVNQLKLLVVDDDPSFLRYVGEVVDESYDLFFSTNGIDALNMLSTVKPDIILLDVVLPGMDGLELCRRIRSVDSTSGMFIVLVSGRAMESDIENGFAAGANSYLTKPFHHNRLISLLENRMQGLSAMQQEGPAVVDNIQKS